MHFDETKKHFKWHGKVEELVIYMEDQLGLLGSWRVKNNGNLHVFKASDNAVTLNWYCSTSTVQVQGSSKESLVEKMSEAARWITSNSYYSFEENDADTNDNAAVLGGRSQCRGCTLLRQELIELRETVYMLSSRVQDLSLMKKQNEAATKHSENTLQRQKQNEALDVIKDAVFNNAEMTSKISKRRFDLRKRGCFRTLKFTFLMSALSSNLAEESPSLISVESDDEDEWTKVQRPKNPKEISTLIIGDSIIKDINPNLMSADGNIVKKRLSGGKVADLSSKINSK